MPENTSLLPDDQFESLRVMAIAGQKGSDVVPDEVWERIVNWAEGVWADWGMLENVFQKNMTITIPNGATEPVFSLTGAGKIAAEKLLGGE